jgi:two-component system, NarL family, nitrate/nitrite response regulator NarL
MRVLVVAASTMAQAGMAALVESVDGLDVAASVSPGSAGDVARHLDPDICLLDLEGALDVEGAVAALAGDLDCPLVVVAEPRSFRQALEAGAAGVLTPGIPAGSLGRALEAVGQGIGVVYPTQALLSDVAPGAPSGGSPGRTIEALSPRELEVLRLLSAGMTNQQLAGALRISEHTAKFHVSAVLGKLGAQSRAEAVATGYQLGLLTL